MRLRKLYCLLTFVLVCSSVHAQGMKPPMGLGIPPAHRIADEAPPKSYADSVKFKADFKELYPLIKPTPNIQERTQTAFDRMSRMFKARGIDSAKAYDSVMKTIDKSMDEKILFDAYRAEFSAEELKSLVGFFKTPAGKHYLEVEGHLVAARNTQIDQYVGRTINMVVMPMGKAMERPQGALPHPRPGQPPMPGVAPMTPPAQPAPAKDSTLKQSPQ